MMIGKVCFIQSDEGVPIVTAGWSKITLISPTFAVDKKKKKLAKHW